MPKDEISYPFNVEAKFVPTMGTQKKRDIQFAKLLFAKTKAFDDVHELDSYSSEKTVANRAGFRPAVYGKDPQFEDLIKSTLTFKWVYTIYRELRAGSDTMPISHAVVAEGKPIFAGGEGGWFKIEGKDRLVLSNHSGHYKPSDSSLKHNGVSIWAEVTTKYGIHRPKLVYTEKSRTAWSNGMKEKRDKEKRRKYCEKYYRGRTDMVDSDFLSDW